MIFPFTLYDLYLFAIYIYFIIDLSLAWDEYQSCYAPIQIFLLLALCSVVAQRVVWTLIVQPDVPRQLNKCLAFLFYWFLPGFFIYLTLQGIVWQVQNGQHTPDCLPDRQPAWSIWGWIIVLMIFDMTFLYIVTIKVIFWYKMRLLRRRIQQLMSEIESMGEGHELRQILLN